MTITLNPRDASATDVAALPCGGFYARYGKRVLDVTITLLAMPLVLPILALCCLGNLIAAGPVFYTQPRLGRHGRVFRLYKLRTMRPDADAVLQQILRDDPARRAEWHTTQKLRDDPRITRFGQVLRRTSLDELPQLFNVLRGDMSLLGPRPMMLDQVDVYGPQLSSYLALRPGISGKWQVSERNDAHFRRRAEIDAEYARELSLRTDLILVMRTLRTLLRSTGL